VSENGLSAAMNYIFIMQTENSYEFIISAISLKHQLVVEEQKPYRLKHSP